MKSWENISKRSTTSAISTFVLLTLIVFIVNSFVITQEHFNGMVSLWVVTFNNVLPWFQNILLTTYPYLIGHNEILGGH